MSNEVRLGWQCEHVIQERIIVAAGQQDLPLAGEVGSFSTVQLAISGDLVPQWGLPSMVQVWSRTPEPYSGTLAIEGSAGSAQLSAQNWSADTTAAALSRQSIPQTGCTVVSRRGRIGVVGRGRVRAEGLGMSGEAISITGWPPWRVSDDSMHVVLGAFAPMTAVAQVTYSSRGERCPRCAGGLVENDARTGTNPAEPVMVQDADLLVQTSLKWLLTRRGSNPVRPWYGSNLWDLVGSKGSGAASEIEARSEVSRVLQDLQRAQQNQARYQVVTDAEKLSRVLSVRATLDPKNQTSLAVLAEVETASGDPVTLQSVYAAPGTASRVQGVGGLGFTGRGLTG